jgi:EAL domain-containing protein (putative c-di-GMP-specific phosphodiesterase class I)
MCEWPEDDFDDLVLSVNVSSGQFHNGDLVASVRNALDVTSLRPARLEIEVTEGTLIESFDVARATLDRLRRLGIRVSIDDFGTGYSSLSYLKRLPIDVLKIDRSFIQGLPDDRDDAAISEAIVRLGHALNMEIVAEGVETPAQFEFLRALECDTAQGYHIAPPLPASEFAEFVGNSAHLLTG